MDSTICPGCHQAVEPLIVYDKSPKSGKLYRILRCPRWRCNFNLDIEPWEGKIIPPKSEKKPDEEDNGRSFWRYGL